MVHDASCGALLARRSATPATKIRRCQNLQGIERKLALFEPPLDPSALVSAAALAGDFGSALAAVSGRAPTYRFRVLLAKAVELWTLTLEEYGKWRRHQKRWRQKRREWEPTMPT